MALIRLPGPELRRTLFYGSTDLRRMDTGTGTGESL